MGYRGDRAAQRREACSRAAPLAGCAGFTYIELVITVAIVALLASVVFPLAELSVQRVKEQELRRALREIRPAIDAYKRVWDEGRIERKVGETGYPPKLELLVEGVEDVRDPKKAKIYFLRRLPRDPFFEGEPATPPAQTWGRRSYASPPEFPEEGEDVFDVFSRSPKKALDGSLYRDW